uniref:Uncharacterized protein n=1 Tax=Plectus sambesii TaxID=2011161 RepID=A0A914V0R9_9BILA
MEGVKEEEIDEEEGMEETARSVERDTQLEDLEAREKALEARETALDNRETALDNRESALRDAEHKLRERGEELDEREKALNDERNSFHREQMLAWEEMRSEQEHIDGLWAKWANHQTAEEGRESSAAAVHPQMAQQSPTSIRVKERSNSPTTARLEEETMEDPESDRELFHNPVYDK